MICPKCSRQMTGGAPHSETYKLQYECVCGNIIGIEDENFCRACGNSPCICAQLHDMEFEDRISGGGSDIE